MDPDVPTASSLSETVEVEVNGQTYRGTRVVTVTGTDKQLRQEIRFMDLSEADPKPHRPGDVARMRSIARVILRDLVEQWKAQETSRPVKVEPHATPQRQRRDK